MVGLRAGIWFAFYALDDSVMDTYDACYKGYYTDKYLINTQAAAPSDKIRQSFRWLAVKSERHNEKVREREW